MLNFIFAGNNKYIIDMKKIMFCGGGSAGHVIPNIALCDQLKGQFELCYTGTCAIEKDICGTHGIDFYEFDAVKLVRGKILRNLAIPFKLIKSIKQCEAIMEKQSPDLLFCKGGYASLPPAFAAKKFGIPVLTHESDLTPGLANRLIARKCRRVLTAFPTTARKFKNGVYAGTPLRRELFGRDKLLAKREYRLDLRPTVIVLGGGSGSKKINEYVRAIAPKLCESYNILHVCGKGNTVYSSVYGYKQVEFIEDMGLAYAAADYAVARCGANSAHELIALKIPTLFIPLENKSSRGDQLCNAEYFANLGLCHVMHENELYKTNLLQKIEELIKDKNLKAALEGYTFKRGNERIIEEIKATLKL